MHINPRIFREYDIRGIAGERFGKEEIEKYEKWYGAFPGITLTPKVALAIGKAYGTLIQKEGGKKVIVGYEIRPFAKEMKDSFVSGVRSTGCDVMDAGVSLTPFIYFAIAFSRFDGGVNITGSHNVYFYNGFKLMKKDVWPIYGEELQYMRTIIEREDYKEGPKGDYDSFNIRTAYERYFLSHIKLNRKLRIVIDSGNGSAGIFAPKLFRELGCEVQELYSEPDATFPHHTPDPSEPSAVKDLSDAVLRHQADLGVGFDADGDRVGFVNEKGEFVDADFILLVLARDALSRHPGSTILYDVKGSHLLEELIPRYGGKPLMHRTGHAPIKETLRKNADIILAGEQSGHYFFAEDYFKIDDGLFAAGKMLQLYSRAKAPFSCLFEDIPFRVRTPEMKLPCVDEKKFEIVESIRKDLEGRFSSILIDGIRIQLTDTAWGLVRASNTSPCLSLRFEGKSEEEVLKIKNILADELEKFPEIGDRLDRKNVMSFKGKLGWI